MYRLNVVPIVVPPLRERARRHSAAGRSFPGESLYSRRIGRENPSADALRRLRDYDWPGNVRQLEHTIEMAITLSGERTRLYSGDIQLPVPRIGRPGVADCPVGGVSATRNSIWNRTVGRVEQLLIQEALAAARRKQGQGGQLAWHPSHHSAVQATQRDGCRLRESSGADYTPRRSQRGRYRVPLSWTEYGVPVGVIAIIVALITPMPASCWIS